MYLQLFKISINFLSLLNFSRQTSQFHANKHHILIFRVLCSIDARNSKNYNAKIARNFTQLTEKDKKSTKLQTAIEKMIHALKEKNSLGPPVIQIFISRDQAKFLL
jgi:hypothetical protein